MLSSKNKRVDKNNKYFIGLGALVSHWIKPECQVACVTVRIRETK